MLEFKSKREMAEFLGVPEECLRGVQPHRKVVREPLPEVFFRKLSDTTSEPPTKPYRIEEVYRMSDTRHDPVNHPSHYTQGEIECIDAIREALGPVGFVAYCRGCQIKYNWRTGLKDAPQQEQAKAEWYAKKAQETILKHPSLFAETNLTPGPECEIVLLEQKLEAKEHEFTMAVRSLSAYESELIRVRQELSKVSEQHTKLYDDKVKLERELNKLREEFNLLKTINHAQVDDLQSLRSRYRQVLALLHAAMRFAGFPTVRTSDLLLDGSTKLVVEHDEDVPVAYLRVVAGGGR